MYQIVLSYPCILNDLLHYISEILLICAISNRILPFSPYIPPATLPFIIFLIFCGFLLYILFLYTNVYPVISVPLFIISLSFPCKFEIILIFFHFNFITEHFSFSFIHSGRDSLLGTLQLFPFF